VQKTEEDGKIYQTMFDTGPDGAALARNLDSLKIDLSVVDRIILSHWHRDHSGGILEFLQRRRDATAGMKSVGGITVDLHPSRPFARGIAPPPSYQKVLCRLPEDPTIKEIEGLGAAVEMSDEGHLVQGDTVYVSGEIPRVTSWEKGLLGGVRYIPTEGTGEGAWVSEPVCGPGEFRDCSIPISPRKLSMSGM
jgi:7,8-dihydropterin-6-yl-methyl-4-(beta-D-ribofuranosyl)aminobenzene 5'-phosphate synthase